ncbi:M14 family metallopeptidase [Allosalinactinospora lopnorensis]|uniref:M14 family metallopeptidase n=1 Tax=Allosalinactinospora lopnorensis TaxID=1352348 RepID=UPI000697C433|nr:M14 family metallopeptidase [Allosalinactinospora lopnorensis]
MRARTLLTPLALVPLFLATAVSSGSAAESGTPEGPDRQYLVEGPETPQERTQVARTGASVDAVGEDAASVTVTATPGEAEAIEDLGHEVTEVPVPNDLLHQPVDPAYHTYDELTGVVDKVVADFPSLAEKTSVGSSHEGRDIMAVRISGEEEAGEDKPEVLFTHQQHAREVLTVEMAIYLLTMFTEEYGSDERITELLDSRTIWILPSVNPDGAVYDTESGSYRNWRKNRQPNSGSNAMGTDLNRNWDYNWGCCGGSSGSPYSQTYRGASPESAPEVNVVADFVRSRVVDGEQRITAHIDFHTYGELVLWPYGYTYDETGPGMSRDDYDAHAELGELMAETNGYTPQQSSDLYVTDGSINDWMWGDQGIFSFTFEMHPGSFTGGGFYPPGGVIEEETARNRDAVLDLTAYADCPYRVIGKEAEYCGSAA